MAEFKGKVLLDPAALDALLLGRDGPVARRMVEDGEYVRQAARQFVGVSKPDPVPRRKPKRPGELRDSIVKRLVYEGRTPVMSVGSDKTYAYVHHEGGKPHTIVPVRAKRLVFFSARAGRVVWAKQVRHPGSRGNPFLLKAVNTLRGRY